MALFGTKKKDTEEKVNTASVEQERSATKKAVKKGAQKKQQHSLVHNLGRDLSSVVVKPRITEKAVLGTDKNVYTFEVQKTATKHDVRDAIKYIYQVTPKKVRIVNKKPRHYTSRLRGRKMMEKGMKKAYVYLREGDRIDLV